MNLSTYSMFPCATAIGCGDECCVIPMAFIFSRLIFSPTCALCSSSLVVIYWHTFSSSATIAMSSAKSKSVKRFRFCQTMPYSYCSSAHDEVDDYDEEEWWKDAALSNPETKSKNSVYPLAVLTQQLALSYSALKMLIKQGYIIIFSYKNIFTRLHSSVCVNQSHRNSSKSDRMLTKRETRTRNLPSQRGKVATFWETLQISGREDYGSSNFNFAH